MKFYFLPLYLIFDFFLYWKYNFRFCCCNFSFWDNFAKGKHAVVNLCQRNIFFILFILLQILLNTSAGDIDIELWSKEAPKACRNFVQLCLEGYYNDTIFHRVVPKFIAQGGDPTGTGTGGESIYDSPFKVINCLDTLYSVLFFYFQLIDCYICIYIGWIS